MIACKVTTIHNTGSVLVGRPYVKRFALCYRNVGCAVCLWVCDVGVLWPSGGWIKMKLGVKAGLVPGHIVLGGELTPSFNPKKEHSPPIFGPCLLWLNGCMGQDATSYPCRPRPQRAHCVRWRPCSSNGKGHSSFPLFGACLLWPNCRPSQQLLTSCYFWAYVSSPIAS